MIVGFCGAAGSGKDTAAGVLIEQAGYAKASFARGLKEVLCKIFGWHLLDWDNFAWKEAPNESSYGLSPRVVAQTLGTEWGRNLIHPDIWVDMAMRDIEFGLWPKDKYVFTDVRFPNEATAIREHGGVLIYVTCTDQPTKTSSNDHESEDWLPWLYLYADCEIKAEFGYIDKLREAALNTVENYTDRNLPRYEPGPEVLERMRAIGAAINAKQGRKKAK